MVQNFDLCGKLTDKHRNKHNFVIELEDEGTNIFFFWGRYILEMSEDLSPIEYNFHLCGKIHRKTNKKK